MVGWNGWLEWLAGMVGWNGQLEWLAGMADESLVILNLSPLQSYLLNMFAFGKGITNSGTNSIILYYDLTET